MKKKEEEEAIVSDKLHNSYCCVNYNWVNYKILQKQLLRKWN